MIYGSVCSGIESATVAWHPLGWRAAWFSEIEKFPCAVLAHHYPHVRNHGDMTKFNDWNLTRGSIDLLVGGTPCQSFSVAGLRKGLGDPRGNLMLTYLAIADATRPRWLVWENVPGVLSSNRGRDFGTLLGGLAKLGYGFAYRVLNAQYFGVPQRRRRVFVIGYFGDWRRAAAVLFERHSLSGNPPPSQGTRQIITGSIRAGAGKRGGIQDQSGECGLIAHALRGEGFDASEDGTGRGTPLIPVSSTGDIAHCLNAGGMGRQDFETETVIVQRAPIAFSCKDYGADAGEISPTLRSMSHSESHANAGGQVAIALSLRGRSGGATAELGDDQSNALRASNGGGDKQHVLMNSAVRRLTPLECERLQGFPDSYTLIPYHNKLAADGPRYKALGNSKAVPVVRWLGERIAMIEGVARTYYPDVRRAMA